MKKILFISTVGILSLSCFPRFLKSKKEIESKRDCIYNINQLSGQFVLFSFYDEGIPISYFTKDLTHRRPNFNFQYGYLSVFFHHPFPPINQGEFEFIYKSDTMRIAMGLQFKINHFIDSIPFKKGKYNIILDIEELYKDSLYKKFMNAAHSPLLRDSVQLFYQNYINYQGRDFSEFYNANQKTENPVNPYKDYFYCQAIQDTNKPISAENYIKDVLNEKFIKVKIKNIIKME